MGMYGVLPSGKQPHNYWTSPFLMGNSVIQRNKWQFSIAMFVYQGVINEAINKWGFHRWGTAVPRNWWFIMENPIHKWGYSNSWIVYFMENPMLQWMNWRYPHFRKPPNARLTKDFRRMELGICFPMTSIKTGIIDLYFHTNQLVMRTW